MLAASASAVKRNLMNAIKQLRERLGLSQQRLADAIGMSLASVRNYEAGAVPSPEALARLRALSPTEFESLFAQSSENRRAAGNEPWHRMLESILNSSREDVISALKGTLIVFNRMVGEHVEQNELEPALSRKVLAANKRRPRAKNT
jgi:transcriptional regulator with XRE-family HTH domain